MVGRGSMVETAGGLSRTLHARGLLRGKASGCVRKLAGKLANRGSYTYRNDHGHMVEANLDDYMERIGFFGAHESAIRRYIDSQLRPGDWVIDVGANVGLLSSPMAAAVGGEGAVWAIEPLPRNVERLRALKERNGLSQLRVIPVGLSSTASTAKLLLSPPQGGSGSGSFVAPWAKEGYIEVPTIPLDELVEADGPDRPLRLVKIDVEGFESQVLSGAEKTLTTRRPLVMCEFHDPLLRAAGSSSEALLRQFAAYGFRPGHPFGRPPGSLDGKVVDMLLVPH